MTDTITLPRAAAEKLEKLVALPENIDKFWKDNDYAGLAALAALVTALAEPDAKREPATREQYPEKGPALSVYNEITATDDPGSPLERLRFFCSLAMRPQDWLDVAPFFDALAEPEPTVKESLTVDAKREPATEKDIDIEFCEITLTSHPIDSRRDFRTGFRAAERFHGIAKEDKT
jgi:hypothetical protein